MKRNGHRCRYQHPTRPSRRLNAKSPSIMFPFLSLSLFRIKSYRGKREDARLRPHVLNNFIALVNARFALSLTHPRNHQSQH